MDSARNQAAQDAFLAPTHFRILVYNEQPPPQGIPSPVSLCLWGRTGPAALTEHVDWVTCPKCRRYIDELGMSDDATPEGQSPG